MDEGHYCLSEVALFRDLTRREMAGVAASAPRRTVPAGQVVYDPSRPVIVLFIVKTGRFRLYRVLADGRTVTTAIPGPGSVFGEMDLLGMRMGGTRAEAIEVGDLCLMSRSDVQTLLERTAHTLGVLAGSCPGGAALDPVRLTHGQLAGLVGATRERTTIALAELAERGLVSLHRGKVHIHDIAGLAALADGGKHPAPHGHRP